MWHKYQTKKSYWRDTNKVFSYLISLLSVSVLCDEFRLILPLLSPSHPYLLYLLLHSLLSCRLFLLEFSITPFVFYILIRCTHRRSCFISTICSNAFTSLIWQKIWLNIVVVPFNCWFQLYSRKWVPSKFTWTPDHHHRLSVAICCMDFSSGLSNTVTCASSLAEKYCSILTKLLDSITFEKVDFLRI